MSQVLLRIKWDNIFNIYRTVHDITNAYIYLYYIINPICQYLQYISKTYRNLILSNSLTFNSVTSFCLSKSWDTFFSLITSEERESSCSATLCSISAKRIKCLLVGTGVGDCFIKSYEIWLVTLAMSRYNAMPYLLHNFNLVP